MPHLLRVTSKTILPPSLWMIFLFLFVGCSPVTPGATPAPAITPTLQVKVMPTSTAISQPTTSPSPTIALTETLPSGSPSVEPTEEVVTVPGLRLAYIVDGNLYVQDSGGKPLQLTHGHADASPGISDDGQKLFFLRSKHSDDPKNDVSLTLYSINADGSGERVLVTDEQIKAIDAQYADLSFRLVSFLNIHGTHHLLFHTSIPENSDQYDSYYNQDLFWVDADSGQIRQLAAINQGWYQGVAPNEKRLAFQRVFEGRHTGQIDLIGLDGKVIQPDIFASMFQEPGSRFSQGYLSVQWSADGGRLLAVPGELGEIGVCPAVWQYSVVSGSVQETVFNPSPEKQLFDISPDGNWMVYTACLGPDYSVGDGIYLGDLRTGTTRKLGDRETYGTPGEYNWSPDNIHFYFSDSSAQKGFIGDISGNMESSCGYNSFVAWIDALRYICGSARMGEVGKVEREYIADFPPGLGAGLRGSFDFVLLK